MLNFWKFCNSRFEEVNDRRTQVMKLASKNKSYQHDIAAMKKKVTEVK